MRGRLKFLVALAVCAVAGMATAERADAGLEFTDFVSTPAPGSSASVRFNGVDAATFVTTAIPEGYAAPSPPGRNLITVTDTGAAPGVTLNAQMIFGYNGQDGGLLETSYAAGANGYDMVIQLGNVTGTVTLSQVFFIDSLGTASNTYNTPFVFTSADSFQRIHIPIPQGTGIPGTGIADAQRLAQQVALLFSFTGGNGVSFTVDAVANPEPSTVALFGLGLAGLAVGLRRRRSRVARAA